MTWSCDRLRDALIEQGMTAVGHDEAARCHLASCAGCRAFLQALVEVDQGLRDLPPIDPPKEVVAVTIGANGKDTINSSPSDRSSQ